MAASFKFVVIGDVGVGKSSLVQRFVDDTFIDLLPITKGIIFRTRNISVDGMIVTLRVWDTAGEEQY